MSGLEGSDIDQDCVSFPEGNCPAVSILILFMVPHLFFLELVSLPVGPSEVFPQFLYIFGGCGCYHCFWG